MMIYEHPTSGYLAVLSYPPHATFFPDLLVRRQDSGSTRRALICPVPALKKSAVIADSAIPEESRQHGERARRERLIDEWFLPFEYLDRGTAGQWVFAGCGIGNLRIEFRYRSQPLRLAAVPAIEWLAQHKLPGMRCCRDRASTRRSSISWKRFSR
jgi:hypothetical protein